MRGIIGRIIVHFLANAIGIFVATHFLDGVAIGGTKESFLNTLAEITAIFGILNFVVGKTLRALFTPLNIITLGLFIFVINGGILLLTAKVTDSLLIINGFTQAILAALIIWIANIVVGIVIKS